MPNLFELNSYESQVETLVSACFILSILSDLAIVIAGIGLTACTVLLGQLVYYPFRCKRRDEPLFVPWRILNLLYWGAFTGWTVYHLIDTAA